MRQIIRATMFAAVAIPVLVFAQPAHAQTLSGEWQASLATHVSIEDGSSSSTSAFAPVALKIDQKGDSLFATFQRGATADVPAGVELKLKGVLKDGAVTLVTEPMEGKLVAEGGEETIIKTVMTLTLKTQNDELVGTMTHTPDMEGIPPMSQGFKAVRKK